MLAGPRRNGRLISIESHSNMSRELNRTHTGSYEPVWVLLSSLDMLECDSILISLPFRLGPANIGYPLTQEPDHKRVFPLHFVRVNREKLRDSIRHHLLELGAGDGLEAA